MIAAARAGRLRNQAGMTLAEVIMAALVVAVIAAGTMMAMVAAAQMIGPLSSGEASDLPSLGEASQLAQQTIESNRNQVEQVGATNSPNLATLNDGQWHCQAPPAVGTASSLTGAVRRFRVTPADCDGVGGAGDCYAVQSQVCWNGQACPCI